MIYVHMHLDTPYCGTSEDTYIEYEDGTSEEFVEMEFLEAVRANAEGFEYLHTGWDDENIEDLEEDEREEYVEGYYEDCNSYSNWEYITKEEYENGLEEG